MGINCSDIFHPASRLILGEGYLRIIKFCVSKLQDENMANMYVKRLEERLKQSPSTGGKTIQEEWDLCKNTIQQVTEEVLGKQASRKRNEWFDEDCERATKEKNEAYLIMQQQYGTRNKVLRYQEKRREEKKIHKKRKQEWEKKQKNFKIYMIPGRLESCTVKLGKLRKNLNQG